MLESLDVDTCLRLLGEQHVGRVAIDDDRGPVVFPVNYTLEQGSVVFRTDLGTKLVGAEAHVAVAFEVDHVDERRRMGWSVVARGKLVEVTDPTELDRLRKLPLEPFAPGDKAHYVQVMTRSISGRRIRLPDAVPPGWFRSPDPGNVWFGRDGDDLLA